MKNKVMVLIIAGILTVGGISVVYAASRSGTTLNGANRPMMGAQYSNNKTSNRGSMMGGQNLGIQSNASYKDMIKIMKDNGFSEAAIAMENRDFAGMNNFMKNISDSDYKKMIDIMSENGYGAMASRMGSIGRQNMTNSHGSMMGK